MAKRAAGMATGLKGIALFEAAKGVLVIVAGLGLVALLHRDAHPGKRCRRKREQDDQDARPSRSARCVVTAVLVQPIYCEPPSRF